MRAAEHRLKKPIEVPRPKPPKKPRERNRKGAQPARGEVSMTSAMAQYAASGRVRKPEQTAAP